MVLIGDIIAMVVVSCKELVSTFSKSSQITLIAVVKVFFRETSTSEPVAVEMVDPNRTRDTKAVQTAQLMVEFYLCN